MSHTKSIKAQGTPIGAVIMDRNTFTQTQSEGKPVCVYVCFPEKLKFKCCERQLLALEFYTM